MVLRQSKLRVLSAGKRFGLNQWIANSAWRRNRLLILCYHGVSLEDEHEWNPSLYVPAGLLRRRFEILREMRAPVLPFGEALERLWAGTLPPRAVTITFDDGAYDFYSVALPLLQEFEYPVTVYFTTYYAWNNRPVFDVMGQYLLWKARGGELRWPGVLNEAVRLDVAGREKAYWTIRQLAAERQLNGEGKDDLLAELSARLGIDYGEIRRKRIMHLMTPEEAREVVQEGVDLQLHTHRHRLSRQRAFVEQEIADNRAHIAQLTPAPARHFCYPGGCLLPDLPRWLQEQGIVSATTCELGIASRRSDPMLLPRLVDTANIGEMEFEAWVAGLPGFLPRRPIANNMAQIAEEEAVVSQQHAS